MASKLRVPVSRLRAGRWVLPDEAGRYATRVHRRVTGDQLCLFDPEAGLEADAVLVSERPAEVDVSEPAPATRTTLCVELWQALGKGDKPEGVVRDTTVLGAERVVFVSSERSVARGTGGGRAERLRRIAIEAARQCGRGDLPSIEGPCSLAGRLASEQRQGEVRLVCAWRDQAIPLLSAVDTAAVRAGRLRVVVLVGPEGGLTDQEVELAVNVGFVPVTLGPLVLRTETAATAILGALRLSVESQSAN